MKLRDCKSLILPLDVIIIMIIALLSFVPVAVFSWQQAKIPEEAPLYAIIYISGVEIDRFLLHEHAQLLYTYTSEHGLHGDQYNLIEINGTSIRVKRDNSPDQIGVNMSWISRPGQTIIVLPHRFLIRIEASFNDDKEIIIPF